MEIIVRIGVTKPDQIDKPLIAQELPYGSVTVEVTNGGLDVSADDQADTLVIANAAILVYLHDEG